MDKIKLILILFFTAAIVLAQSRYTDPRSIAMGNSFSISSQGIYSIQSNPANLVLTKNIHFEFSTLLPLPSVNANAGNDFMTLDDLDYYFGGVRNSDGSLSSRYLDETEKNNLKSLFSNGTGIRTNVVVNLLSFSIYFSPQIEHTRVLVKELILLMRHIALMFGCIKFIAAKGQKVAHLFLPAADFNIETDAAFIQLYWLKGMIVPVAGGDSIGQTSAPGKLKLRPRSRTAMS